MDEQGAADHHDVTPGDHLVPHRDQSVGRDRAGNSLSSAACSPNRSRGAVARFFGSVQGSIARQAGVGTRPGQRGSGR
jgi:hypothetical protein